MKTNYLVFSLTLLFGLLSLLPVADGVVPPPDGCYPGFTTAEGCGALNSLTTGAGNTALGWRSLFLNTAGEFNTGVGTGTLTLNNANSNTAVGAAALLLNTTGGSNTAVGTAALVHNDSGDSNTAAGASTLTDNIAGSANTAVGTGALQHNNDDFNTAIGTGALHANISGFRNTAVGVQALANLLSGIDNIAIGLNAGSNHGSSDSQNIDIDNSGATGENSTIRIGTLQNATFIAGIHNAAVMGAAVVVSNGGQLGVATSSQRFKTDIKPMDKSSEALLAMKPVVFRYNKQIDPAGTLQFGLVAEDLAELNPDLVVRDKEGKPYTVRYDQVNAMLLNEFLKEHRAFVQEQRKVDKQQKEIDALKAELREQKSLIQKVSDKVELKKSTSQVVTNNQ
jgi:hypothetical protein